MAAGTLDKEIAPGGGGGIDNPPRPVDFDDDSDDPRAHQRFVVERAALSADYIRRYGGVKPKMAGNLHEDLAKAIERKLDTAPWAGEVAIIGYNQFDYEASPN